MIDTRIVLDFRSARWSGIPPTAAPRRVLRRRINPMPETPVTASAPATSNWPKMLELLRPHWKALSLALLAVIGETATDLAEPWPLKIIVDNLLQSKHLA